MYNRAHSTGRIEGRLAFMMFLCRMAHPFCVRGTMEYLYGYDRTQITRWTNMAREWFLDRWWHLTILNEDMAQRDIHMWAHKIGTKMHMAEPETNTIFGFIDGVFR